MCEGRGAGVAALCGLVVLPRGERPRARPRAPIGLMNGLESPRFLDASIEHGSSLKLASRPPKAVGPSLAPVGPSQWAVLARKTTGTGRIAWNAPDRPNVFP